MHKMDSNCKKPQAGFSMTEVLVSIVILSFGLLGLAGLQADGLRSNQDAYMRSQATLLAYDMLDRMRANLQGIESGFYDDLFSVTPVDPDCVSSGCTILEMSQHDAFEWNSKLSELLPGGRGLVVGTGPGSVFTITVMWDERRTGVTGTDCSGNPQVDLACFTLSSII